MYYICKKNIMDLQVRKLNFIQEFLRITDENIISKLEYLIKIEKKKQHESDFKPMEITEFYKMIDQAKADSENGNVISQQDLKTKIKSWK
jgi:hypothetical protein